MECRGTLSGAKRSFAVRGDGFGGPRSNGSVPQPSSLFGRTLAKIITTDLLKCEFSQF